MAVYTTDSEEQVVTKAPIDTDKPSPSAAAIIETTEPSPSDEVPAVATRAPVEVVKRTPIYKGKTPFQPVTNTFFPSAKLPSSLSSIYVPMKPSPVTTDCIHPKTKIIYPEYRNFMFDRANIFKKIEKKCLDMDKACHTYFTVTGKIFVMNCY